jgi:DNA-binding CsgD family transcriptional regulator
VEPRVVGLAPLEPVEYGRHIGVEIAWSGSGGSDAGACVPRLEAVMRELARRALVAFGPEPLGPANRVTDREREVLDMLAHGHSVREIADSLARSPHTVHDHVKSLHRKLRVSTRGELIARAMGHMGTSRTQARRQHAWVASDRGR